MNRQMAIGGKKCGLFTRIFVLKVLRSLALLNHT